MKQRLYAFMSLIWLSLWLQSFSVQGEDAGMLGGRSQEETSPSLDIQPPQVIHWTPLGGYIHPEQRVSVRLHLATDKGFHLYHDHIRFSGPPGFMLLDWKGPSPQEKFDAITHKDVRVFSSGEFEVAFQRVGELPPNPVSFYVEYLGCADRICLFPYQETISMHLYPVDTPYVLSSGPGAASSLRNSISETVPSALSAASAPSAPLQMTWEEELLKDLKEPWRLSFVWLLCIACFGGLLTNLTPCVYPMIPITVKLLARQGRHPYRAALSYSAGIMSTYTALGIGAALTGGLFGQWMASPWTNTGLSLLMISFALGMLGFKSFHSIQAAGHKMTAKQPGLGNAWMMGVGAGFVASPCTGPILAALLTYAASLENGWQGTVLLGAYSFGFACPYALLGGLSGRASRIKLGPAFQNAVKLIFAGFMFGLAFYYARIPLYPWHQKLAAWWHWIAAGAGCMGGAGFIWHVYQKFRHGSALLSLWTTVSLGLSMFAVSQTPKWYRWFGASPVALLETKGGAAAGNTEAGSIEVGSIDWLKHMSFEEALALASQDHRPLLVDLWAEWCEACKNMDQTTFQDRDLGGKLAQGGWILLRLDVTQMTLAHETLQRRFDVTGLPSLVVITDASHLEHFKVISGYQSSSALWEQLQEHMAASGMKSM